MGEKIDIFRFVLDTSTNAPQVWLTRGSNKLPPNQHSALHVMKRSP